MDRKFDLLKTIIEAHIERAIPIGSKLIVEEYHFPVSPATVRNEMMELEEEGYLQHPHTSAGRIPTEKGYQWYVGNAMESKQPEDEWELVENMIFQEHSQRWEELLKMTTRAFAQVSGEAAVAHTPTVTLAAGLSQLYAQPECMDREVILRISTLMDRLDEVMDMVSDAPTNTVQILIGNQSPLGGELSMVTMNVPTNPPTTVGVMGPLRMPYAKAAGMLELWRDEIIERY